MTAADPAERDARFWDFNPTARPYATLHPPEWFSDRRLTAAERKGVRPEATPETMGPNSLAVQMHQASTCAGWRKHPTSREFYDAIRAEKPTERERIILEQWTQEARWDTIFAAWAEDVYSMRELVQALHRADLRETRWSRTLNGWARVPDGEG